MHVLHVVRQFHPAIGGLEDMVANLAVSLQNHGVRSSIVTLDRVFSDTGSQLPRVGEYEGIPITRIRYFGSKRYPIALSVLREIRRADIVHVHGIDFFFDFLALTRFFHGKILFASTHGGFFHTKFGGRFKELYFGLITRMTARSYEKIIASSVNDLQMFKSISENNTSLIENGVNIEKWSRLASAECRSTIITIGRFSENKNIPALIELVGKLGSEWRLVIAGVCSDISSEELYSIAEKYGVRSRVEIHVGLEPAEIGNLISKATYIASASRYEGFGLTIIEGMSAGLIPLLNDIPPFRRFVEESRVGIVQNMDDLSAIARKLSSNHRNTEQRLEEEKEACIAYAAKFGWGAVSGDFAKQYESSRYKDPL